MGTPHEQFVTSYSSVPSSAWDCISAKLRFARWAKGLDWRIVLDAQCDGSSRVDGTERPHYASANSSLSTHHFSSASVSWAAMTIISI